MKTTRPVRPCQEWADRIMSAHDKDRSALHLTRRGLLTAGGAVLIGAASGCSVNAHPAKTSLPSSPSDAPLASKIPDHSVVHPFFGEHQSGVETPPALLQTFIGLNLVHGEPRRARADGEACLRLITDDAARLTQGLPALGDTEPALARHPQGLTITAGLGRSFFDKTGLTRHLPQHLVEVPPFETDRFEDPWKQTDLVLQVGSDDAVTLAHALRMLTKDLSTLTEVAWTQSGFRSASPAQPGSNATRNLMGQVDGTVNPIPGSQDFHIVVWQDSPGLWKGSTILVLRRIRLHLDAWDGLDTPAKELIIGRTLDSGAPLGRERETDPVPFDELDAQGLPVIPADSHIAVAHAASVEESILRRPYNYDAGMTDGTNDIGLVFAAYMRDPRLSFIPMQERIAKSDAFNRWNTTIGSAVYVLPGGVPDGGFIAEGLFSA